MKPRLLVRVLRETPGVRKLAPIGIIILLAEVAIAPALAHTIRLLIDGFLDGDLALYLRLAPVAIGLFVFHALVAWLRVMIPGRISELACADLRLKAARGLLNMPVSRLDLVHSGDYLSRLTNDISVLANYFSHQLFWLVALPLMALASIGYQMYITWQLTLITLGVLPAMIWVTTRVSQPIGEISRHLQQSLAEVNNVIQDALGGAEVVKAYNLQGEMERRHHGGVDKFVSFGLSLARQRALLRAASVVAGFTPFFLPLALGGWYAVNGLITTGSLVAFIQLLNNVTFPLSQMPMVLGDHHRAMAALERIFQVVDGDRERAGGQVFSTAGRPVLEVNDIFFGYEDEEVLKGLTFTVDRGEMVALVSPSGAGKSTIFKVLTGLYPIGRGEIKLFGHPLEQWQLAALRRHMAWVGQDTFLFPGTVAENIALGAPGASEEEIIRAAKQANAHEFIQGLPGGYQHILNERGANLSGGQRQRLAIARAILQNAPLLLLDEATSALDTESERLVQAALDLIATSRTTLVIAHRLSTIRSADRILVVDDGKIVEQGSHQQLLDHDGLYSQLYLKQLQNQDNEGGVV